jgi:putative redox protein
MPTTVSVLASVVHPQRALRVDVVTGTGFNLTFDTADAGELRAGAGPTESLLAALAGCASMDVGPILRKKRQQAASYRISVTGERSDEHPRIYTGIVVEHQVSGEVEPEALRRAIELSATRYCPVNAMLSRAVRIEHRYRLVREGHEEISALVAITGPEGAQVL